MMGIPYLKLILQPHRQHIVFAVLFVAFYEVALFVEVEFVIGLHTDVFVEAVQTADTECALG